MDEIKLRAHAKINLFLSVEGVEVSRGKRLHALDTVMCSVKLGDDVSVGLRADDEFNVFFDGERIEGTNAEKAARAVSKRFGLGGADIFVVSRVPQGAGLGGSSADAAAVINAMSLLCGLGSRERELIEIADGIGSDVPYMLGGGLARMRGTGRAVTPLDCPLCGGVLLCGKGRVDTAACFNAFDEAGENGAASCESFLDGLRRGEIEPYNALTAAACSLNPSIADVTSVMKRFGLRAAMTGSGSYAFGLGDEKSLAEAASALIERGYAPILTEIAESGFERL